jgi:hypothetical protein
MIFFEIVVSVVSFLELETDFLLVLVDFFFTTGTGAKDIIVSPDAIALLDLGTLEVEDGRG